MKYDIQRRAICGSLAIVLMANGTGASPAMAAQREALSPNNTLVAAMEAAIKTLDPAHEYESVDGAADHEMYDTLVTFSNGVLTNVTPRLATKWTITDGGKVYTFTLRSGVRFSNGDPLTSADVVFSFNRVKNLQGNPSFLLDSMASITAPSPSTARITLYHPDPAFLNILTNPALGIENSNLVIAHGGTAAANASNVDTAETYLDRYSAGSGPYMLTSVSPGQSIAMTANPNYWGLAPKVKNLLLVNQLASTERLTLEKGDVDIALNLSPDQYPSLKSDSRLTTYSLGSSTVFYLVFNMNPSINAATANNDVRQAVRYALDNNGLVALAGQGSIQSPGLIPQELLGAMPLSMAVKQNVAKAKALLKAAGFPNGFTTTLLYKSNVTYSGEDLGIFAQKIQSDLAAIGITIKLMPTPIAVELPYYRAGKEQMALEPWTPDYPDPEDYLAFLPGHLVGKRANWKPGADSILSKLMQQAQTTLDSGKRALIYRQIQERLNAVGPYIPLIEPPQVVATQRVFNNAVIGACGRCCPSDRCATRTGKCDSLITLSESSTRIPIQLRLAG